MLFFWNYLDDLTTNSLTLTTVEERSLGCIEFHLPWKEWNHLESMTIENIVYFYKIRIGTIEIPEREGHNYTITKFCTRESREKIIVHSFEFTPFLFCFIKSYLMWTHDLTEISLRYDRDIFKWNTRNSEFCFCCSHITSIEFYYRALKIRKIFIWSSSHFYDAFLPHFFLFYIVIKTRSCWSRHIRWEITPVYSIDPHIGSLYQSCSKSTKWVIYANRFCFVVDIFSTDCEIDHHLYEFWWHHPSDHISRFCSISFCIWVDILAGKCPTDISVWSDCYETIFMSCSR